MALPNKLKRTSSQARKPETQSTANCLSSLLMHSGRAFLLRLRQRSIRRNNSWFRVLSLESRRFIDVVIQTVEKIRSSLLLKLLTPLTEKLLTAIGGTRGLMGELAYKMQDYGFPLTQRISEIAVQWGNKTASKWANDADFARYLTVTEINNHPFFQASANR